MKIGSIIFPTIKGGLTIKRFFYICTILLVVLTQAIAPYKGIAQVKSDEIEVREASIVIPKEENDTEFIPVYSENPDMFLEENQNSDILENLISFEIKENSRVEVLESHKNYSLIKIVYDESNIILNDSFKEDHEMNESEQKTNEKGLSNNTEEIIEEELILEGYIENIFIETESDNNVNDAADNSNNESNEADSEKTNDVENEVEEEIENDSISNEKHTEEDNVITDKNPKTQTMSIKTTNSISYSGIALKNKTHIYSDTSKSSKSLKSYDQGSILKYSSYNNNWYKTGVFINGKKQNGFIHKDDVENALNQSESLEGIALLSPTHIFLNASTSAKSLKSYNQGAILKYSTFSENWYKTGIFINGKKHTGYIHKSHVENATNKSISYQGIALKAPTNIYSSASTSAKSLKSYNQGAIIKYSTFSKDWYKTGVFINGKKHTGYIHKSHVENATDKPISYQGVALKAPTNIYSNASTSSKSLKSYNQGTILKYSTFSKNWYKTGVFINGKKHTGYIHKSHVDNATLKPQSSFGVALKPNINVYTSASKSSKALKGYKKGHILKFSTFTSEWYKTGVMINGKKEEGYIHKSDVGMPNDTVKMRGIALKQPTQIYDSPFSTGKSLKTYSKGSILQFSSYGNGWYKTGIFINGVKKEGYIKATDVEVALLESEQEIIDNVFTLNDPTNIYQNANTSSKVIKTYKKGSSLKVRSFSKNWYQARVKVNNTYVLGYIPKNTLGKKVTKYKTTSYNISLKDAVKLQMNIRPLTSSPKTTYSNMYVHKDALIKNGSSWKINGNNWNVRSGPNNSSPIIGSIGQNSVNDTITVYGESGNYYRFHTWIVATEQDVQKKLNPNNFSKGSNAYYQFLDLSTSANINSSEVNNKILKGKGILEGKANAFNQAAKKYKVNELYLISHAMLETGNGTSDLAKGDYYNGIKVYNMYGIGAADSCSSPYQCGLKTAFENKWFTPEDAIVGGAEFIGEKYIANGQNTLYKMRWNPDAMAKGRVEHQYATDIGWAEKQTSNIKKYYDMLDNYSLTFDVPNYK